MSSLDFVGYSTGKPGAAPPAGGFFGFFDGTGIPVGMLQGQVAGTSSYPRREQKRRWFDPALARAIESDRLDKEARRLELSKRLAEAVDRLHHIGQQVPPLAKKLEQTVKPFKSNRARQEPVLPAELPQQQSADIDARELGREIAREMELDLRAMADSLETVAAIDDLLEWAEEEEVVLILLSQL